MAHRRVAPLRTHFMPDLLIESIPLILNDNVAEPQICEEMAQAQGEGSAEEGSEEVEGEDEEYDPSILGLMLVSWYFWAAFFFEVGSVFYFSQAALPYIFPGGYECPDGDKHFEDLVYACGERSPGRHCHFTLSLAAVDCRSIGIYTVILLSLLSFFAEMTVSPVARRAAVADVGDAGQRLRDLWVPRSRDGPGPVLSALF